MSYPGSAINQLRDPGQVTPRSEPQSLHLRGAGMKSKFHSVVSDIGRSRGLAGIVTV